MAVNEDLPINTNECRGSTNIFDPVLQTKSRLPGAVRVLNTIYYVNLFNNWLRLQFSSRDIGGSFGLTQQEISYGRIAEKDYKRYESDTERTPLPPICLALAGIVAVCFFCTKLYLGGDPSHALGRPLFAGLTISGCAFIIGLGELIEWSLQF
jgi:hypothetical protein